MKPTAIFMSFWRAFNCVIDKWISVRCISLCYFLYCCIWITKCKSLFWGHISTNMQCSLLLTLHQGAWHVAQGSEAKQFAMDSCSHISVLDLEWTICIMWSHSISGYRVHIFFPVIMIFYCLSCIFSLLSQEVLVLNLLWCSLKGKLHRIWYIQ
jgi:hypothetical protein